MFNLQGTLGYDFYLGQRPNGDDMCGLRTEDGRIIDAPCDMAPGPRSASVKERALWQSIISGNFIAPQIGADPSRWGMFRVAIQKGQLDFDRFRDKNGALVGKFFDGTTLRIKPIAGGILDKPFQWAHDNLCWVAAGSAGAGTASASVAVKAKAACDALQAANSSSGPGGDDGGGLPQRAGMSTGMKVGLGVGGAVVAIGLGWFLLRR